MESPRAKRPPVFINGLTRLPRELVHRVLDDLPLIQVLQILSHKIGYLDSCIQSHILYKTLFTSPREIHEIIDIFILHRDICRWRSISLTDNHLFMTTTPSNPAKPFRYADGPLTNQLSAAHSYLSSHIKSQCGMGYSYYQALKAAGPVPCPAYDRPATVTNANLQEWRDRWEWIKTAQLSLNQASASQYLRAATLIKSPLGRLTLKTPFDPSQDAPRPNTKHIANRLRSTARKILKRRQPMFDIHDPYCGYGIDGLILVPYDRFLWTFLEGVDKYQNEKLTLYPEIKKGIDIVLAGLANVYTTTSHIIPRIEWDPAVQGWRDGKEQPVFSVAKDEKSGMHLCPKKRVVPIDGREMEWLEAFVMVVGWMDERNKEYEGWVVCEGVEGIRLDATVKKE